MENFEVHENGNLEYLESSKKVGEFYFDYINSLAGYGNFDESLLDSMPEESRETLKLIINNSRKYFEAGRVLKEHFNMGAKEFLVQAFGEDDILEDESKYNLQELSEGVYCVFIDIDVLKKLYKTEFFPQAMVAKVKEGIPFIIMPVSSMKNSSDSDFFEVRKKENLPHETNHIIWHFLKLEGSSVVESTEDNDDINKNFLMFKEELICQLSSNGMLHSYSYLSRMNDKQRNEFKEQKPKIFDYIYEIMDILNGCLRLISKSIERAGLRKDILILPVLKSKSFDELHRNLLEIKVIIDSQPSIKTVDEKKSEAPPGWGFA